MRTLTARCSAASRTHAHTHTQASTRQGEKFNFAAGSEEKEGEAKRRRGGEREKVYLKESSATLGDILFISRVFMTR